MFKGILGKTNREGRREGGREGGRGRDCSVVDNWKAGRLRLQFTQGWNKLPTPHPPTPQPFIQITWELLHRCHWLKINFLIKLLQEQIISQSWPAVVSPPLSPLEVSVTLTCAHTREWRCHGLLRWVGGEFAACFMVMSAEWLHGAKLRLFFFLFQTKSPSSPLLLSLGFFISTFPCISTWDGMNLFTHICISLLQKSVLTPVYCSVRVSWLFKRNS